MHLGFSTQINFNLCFCTYLTEVECSISCVLVGLSFFISLCLCQLQMAVSQRVGQNLLKIYRTSHICDSCDFRMTSIWLFLCIKVLTIREIQTILRLKNYSSNHSKRENDLYRKRRWKTCLNLLIHQISCNSNKLQCNVICLSRNLTVNLCIIHKTFLIKCICFQLHVKYCHLQI